MSASDDARQERDESVAAKGGYAKPPVEHRFKKGQSGNPKGRPKKPKPDNTKLGLDFGKQPANQMLMAEAYRPVAIREGDKVIELPAIQAVFRAMGVSAMKGNRYAQRTLAEMVQNVEEQDRQLRSDLMKTAIEYKSHWMCEIAMAKQQGLRLPDPLPHPDDIIIDLHEGTVTYAGPLTPEAKVEWDRILARRDAFHDEAVYFAAKYERARGPAQKEMWLERWHFQQRYFDQLNDNLPERYQRKLENRSFAAGASRPGDSSPNEEFQMAAVRTAFGIR